nr:DUF1661 domain-containing protein [Porphyromonas gulae]
MRLEKNVIVTLTPSHISCPKTWCENFSLLVREVKKSRATTKKFSRHFIRGLQTRIRLFSVRISDKVGPD